MKEIYKRESGQVMILALILLAVGGLVITPLLYYMGSGLKVGQAYEELMDELYAADAGVEDAIFNIITPTAPHYQDLQNLDEGDWLDPPYTLTDINGKTVDVAIKKLSLLQGLIGEDEYRPDRPHADWIDFEIPPEQVVYGADYVEYTCHVTITHDGAGNATLESVGAFFSPIAGDHDMVEGPYGYEGTEIGEMDFSQLESGSPEKKFSSGGFAFIWRFISTGPNKIVLSSANPTAGFSFKFKVYDSCWEYNLYFVWCVIKRQDIAFATNAPDLYKWLIETSAGDTDVKTVVFEQIGALDILTWEINPPE